jgi:hypothetical protein
MTLSQTNLQDVAKNEKSPFLAGCGAAVLVGALAMTWPAFYNGYPLLYPDSMTYLGNGRPVARALFLHQSSSYYGERSFIYSLGILPLHWNITPWPIVAFQALLTSYVICLVIRSVLTRQATLRYLALIMLLSSVTSVSWYDSLIMPDILGPTLYLCIYLLVFGRETLSSAEHVTLVLIAWWAVVSHATHLILSVAMVLLLSLLLVLRLESIEIRWRAVREVGIIVSLAAVAQSALNAYLYGEPSFFGERPPFLMARVIADGPGRWYLEQHCPEVKLTICGHVHNLPYDSDDFLWRSDGVWQSADEATQQRLRHEEIPFVLATLRAYPGQQLSKSILNFWRQLTSFSLRNFDSNKWILDVFDSVFPGGRPQYLRRRQPRNQLPLGFFTSVQKWTIIVSLVVICSAVPRLWRRRPHQLVGLTMVIVPMVVANALVTGDLSVVEDRFQCRVIWLLALLAGLFLLDSCDHWHDRNATAKNHPDRGTRDRRNVTHEKSRKSIQCGVHRAPNLVVKFRQTEFSRQTWNLVVRKM